MTEKFKKIVNLSLLLVILSMGFFSVQPYCSGLLSNRCLQANSLNSTGEASVSTCADKLCYSAPLSVDATKDGFCCKEKACDYKWDIAYGNQCPKIQKYFIAFETNDLVSTHKVRTPDFPFNPYHISQSTPIYILIQSFLC